MTTVEVLKAARAKIEQGWTQGAFAVSEKGRIVGVRSRRAKFWCALGATLAVDTEGKGREADDVLKRVVGPFVGCWNDEPGRTQAEVLAAFDKAIELAEAGQ